MKSDVASPHFGSPVECNDLSLIVYTAQQSQVKKILCKYSPSASEKNKTNNNLKKKKSRFYHIHRLNFVFHSLVSQVVGKLCSAYSSSKYGEHFLFIKLIESGPPGHHERLQNPKYHVQPTSLIESIQEIFKRARTNPVQGKTFDIRAHHESRSIQNKKTKQNKVASSKLRVPPPPQRDSRFQPKRSTLYVDYQQPKYPIQSMCK